MHAIGEAFWLCGDDEDRSHLHVIISNPSVSPNLVLVPVTTIYNTDIEYACTFAQGDHPRIHHDSYVDYRQAKLITVADLDAKIGAKTVKGVEPISTEHLTRIWQGAEHDANFIPRGCRKILFDQGLLG